MASTPLQQLIIERIHKEVPLTFAEYMRMALYEPPYGYYVSGSARMGWEGDYYTSTDVSTFFAHCLARQLYQWWQKLGQPSPFIVLEQGAGRGELAQQVQNWTKQEAPDFNAVLTYHIEDIRLGQDANAPLPDAQKNAGMLPTTPSVILSNELIDAFPVHIVEVLYAQRQREQPGRVDSGIAGNAAPVAGVFKREKGVFLIAPVGVGSQL